MREVFHTFDKGGKNYMTEEEFEFAMRSTGDQPLNETEWKEILKKAEFDEEWCYSLNF
jgi:Ca2+-binding EF-hand superfamily protein